MSLTLSPYQPSGEEIVNFFLSAPFYEDWQPDEITAALIEADAHDGIGIVIRDECLSGVCLGKRTSPTTFHITQLHTRHPRDLGILIRIFLDRFAGLEITAKRRGRMIKYDTGRLIQKLLVKA